MRVRARVRVEVKLGEEGGERVVPARLALLGEHHVAQREGRLLVAVHLLRGTGRGRSEGVGVGVAVG